MHKVTEAQDVDSGTFPFQVDIFSHNASTHLVVVGLPVRIEVCLSIIVGNCCLGVESDKASAGYESTVDIRSFDHLIVTNIRK